MMLGLARRRTGQALRRRSGQALRRCSGQASLEMAVSIIGALLILIGAVKVFLWSTQRLVDRYQNYDGGLPVLNWRSVAGSMLPGIPIYPAEPNKPLDIFTGD